MVYKSRIVIKLSFHTMDLKIKLKQLMIMRAYKSTEDLSDFLVTPVRAYFSHLLGAVPTCSALFALYSLLKSSEPHAV